ncbi:G1/S-specific cyclin-E-like [Tubulanus polymorphus]|uniref:G1/S-specific cyclin-E-like n=1 Tax=Tubulanus polymorphus TaxID=672921 RepID=UPI003DA455AF
MPRKSIRIQSQKSSSSSLKSSNSANIKAVPIILNRKRKAEEDPEGMSLEKRRHLSENQWVPISVDTSVYGGAIKPSRPVPVDMVVSQKLPIDEFASQFRFSDYFTTPSHLRPCPLPRLDWADSKEVWQVMLKKDELYIRNPQMLDDHPQLQMKMRTILLDWLVEVCEVYRLTRDTYYLAVDFIDRYLSAAKNVGKEKLQLLGISALFISSKTEEIYPPKLADFAYVTDGACSEEEILAMELIMLKTLKWDLCPMTSIQWMNLFLQLMNTEEEDMETDNGLLLPQYSSHFYVQLARLLDLVTLDAESLQFTYGVLAASAFCHLISEQVAMSVSGFKWIDLAPCVEWMLPYALTVEELGHVEMKYYSNVSPEMAHFIQTHVIELGILESVKNKKFELTSSRASPDVDMQQDTGLLTPPQSSKKCDG